MIDPKELRIGNAVLRIKDRKEIFIDGDLFADILGGEYYNSTDDFDPIPLTEEWLLKFGFEVWDNSSTDYSYDSEEIYCMVRKLPEGYIFLSEDWDYINGTNPIQYVHHFQNLFFPLYGKELELKKEAV